VLVQHRPHHFAIQHFLRRTVPEEFRRIQMRAEDIPHDLIVPPAEHLSVEVLGHRNTEAAQVHSPDQRMDRVRIHDHTVEIEDQPQSRHQIPFRSEGP